MDQSKRITASEALKHPWIVVRESVVFSVVYARQSTPAFGVRNIVFRFFFVGTPTPVLSVIARVGPGILVQLFTADHKELQDKFRRQGEGLFEKQRSTCAKMSH